MKDSEQNQFTARARRYARVGTQLSGTAARFAGARFFGVRLDRAANALELAAALGGLKGPIMKVAQLLATIPDALPPEYANELMKLQKSGPTHGMGIRQKADERRAGSRLAEEIFRVRTSPGCRRFARSSAPCARARRERGCLQTAISRYAVSGRGRPQPIAVTLCNSQTVRSGDRHQRDRGRDRRASAGRARLWPGGETRRALSTYAQR